MSRNVFDYAVQLVEKCAAEDERVEGLRLRIMHHLESYDGYMQLIYADTDRFFFTLYPQRYGLTDEQSSPEQQDPDKSIAEVIVANREQIAEEKWFGGAEDRVWVALIALDYLVDSLLTRRIIENLISRGDVEYVGDLEKASISVASHMTARCFETAEILTVADCFALEKKSQRAIAKKGAQKRHERSYKAIRLFVEYYQQNGSLSRNEAARRFYRDCLARSTHPLYRNEEQAVRALTAGLRRSIGLKK